MQEQPPFPEELSPVDQAEDAMDYEQEDVNAVQEKESDDFYRNIAQEIEGYQLSSLASQLIQEVEDDEESRSDWERVGKIGLKYLGITVEDQKSGAPVQDIKLSSCYDSSLIICWLRACTTARKELLPASGPCKVDVIGIPTPEIEEKKERAKIFSNHYLTNIDEDYYPDKERLINFTVLWGSCFTKVYQDPLDDMPKARFIPPQDFIVNVNTTSLLSSDRLTHRVYYNRRDVDLLEDKGTFLPSNLPEVAQDDDSRNKQIDKIIEKIDGVTKGSKENKSLFEYLEVHTYVDAAKIDDKFKGRKPYIITICRDTKKIVSIKRNWEQEDTKFRRMECFVAYYHMPGFGLYGLGQAHLCASNVIGATTLLRQGIDLMSFRNFPAGYKRKSAKADQNNMALMPGEFRDLDTDEDLSAVFRNMPYPDLSPAAIQLKDDLFNKNMTICGVAESKIPEMGVNAPVGTTLALLEVEIQVTSAILSFLHKSLKREFKLLFKLFAKHLPNTPWIYNVPGGTSSIMRTDFSDEIHIVPVSDINALTSTHRLVYAESILRLAQQYPDIHNMKEVYRRLYSSMNIQDVDKILQQDPDPVSLDALSEVMLIIMGKPVKAIFVQDHESHVLVKKRFLNNPILQQNIQAYLMIQSNIQQHQAYVALNQLVQQKMQQQEAKEQEIKQQFHPPVDWQPIPPAYTQMAMERQQMEAQIQQFQTMDISEIQLIPEIQNLVSKMDADQAKQEMEAEQQQMQEQKEMASRQVDPNVVMMAEIQQKDKEAALHQEAAKLRAEVDAFKAQMQYETDKLKIALEERVASEKNEKDLVIMNLKQELEMAKMESQEKMADQKVEIEREKLGHQPIQGV